MTQTELCPESVSNTMIKKGECKNSEQHIQLSVMPAFSLFFGSQTLWYMWK